MKKNCDVCGRKYWAFMSEYHQKFMHVARGLDEKIRRFPKPAPPGNSPASSDA